MLTPHQQASLARDRHLSVTANAGSGKTRVLVERYLDILLRCEAEVGEVVALTYTEKAASELKRKIAERLSDELTRSVDPRTTHHLEQVRERLSAAFIGTIHSFCARLLREYPVEAGVDAAFTVIEGLEQHSVLQEALKETFSSVLRAPVGDARRDRLVDAVRGLGKRRVVTIIQTLVDKRERLERLTEAGGFYTRSDDEILGEWAARIQESVVSDLTAAPLRAALERVEAALDGPSAERVRTLAHGIHSDAPPLDFAKKVFEIITALLKQDGGLYRSMASGGAEAGVAAEVEILSRVRDDVLPFAGVVLGGEDSRHAELLAYSRVLVDVAQECLERYAAKKSERGVLDFEDLQLSMRALLRKEAIRSHLAGRFKFIMVDEYQDTNKIQYELLRPLLQNLTSGNLFIVGDPKQSIYSFRGADVSVFDETCRDLVRANGPSAMPGQIVLGESFRPLRDLAAFVNLIFQPLMGKPGKEGRGCEVGYEPIVRARQNSAPGRVELIVPGPSEGVSLAEPDRIALAIQELVNSEQIVYDGSESPQPVRWADIAILLRSRAPLPDLELSLARAGIPYVVTGGVGYFQTQDILDFSSYLQFLLNVGDDVALLGILRSPFFTVSDIDLLEAVAAGRRGTLWEDLLRQKGRGALAPRLTRALDLLQEDLVICHRLSTPDILARIVQRTEYMAKISGLPRGAQAAANLEKLRRMAQAFDVQGFTSVFDFAAHLRRLIDEEEEEGQGQIETQTDAVQIMTVHAAKGLEFPVVVLPFLHRAFRYDNEPFLHDRLGLGFARIGEEGDPEEYPLTAFLRRDARWKTMAEEERIFYVACTRARDVLFLSADPARARSGPSWMRWLYDGLGSTGEPPRESLSFDCVTGTLELQGAEYRAGTERLRLQVAVRPASATRAADAPLPPSEQRVQSPTVFASRIPPSSAGEIFSATRIRVYRDCPAHYYLRYILGMPQESSLASGEEAEELLDADFPPDLRGRIFHGVMEQIDHLPTSSLHSEIQRLLSLEVSPGSDRLAGLVDDVHRMVGRVVGSPFWQRVAGGSQSRTEFTISAVLGEDYLSGTMDRVYQDRDGYWHVLDYKTDRVEPSEVTERAEEYWPQLEFYALLVHLYFKSEPIVAELLFAAAPQQVLRREFSSAALLDARSAITSVISRIKSNDFPPRVSSCSHCPFFSACPWNPHTHPASL
jgi:ATP-dependent helicase/nuclease subunit A